MNRLLACLVTLLAVGAATDDVAEIPAESVRSAIETAFRATAPPEARLEIVSLPTLRTDGGARGVVVARPGPADPPGPRGIEVEYRVDDRVVSRGVARVVVRVRRTVWVAVHDLERDASLDLSALRRESREFDHATPPAFRPEPGERFRLVRDVSAGAVLEVRDVCRVPDPGAGTEADRASVSTTTGGVR